jgi:hypothetical protein
MEAMLRVNDAMFRTEQPAQRSLFGIEPLTPAYGRDYTSLKAMQEDFDNNKDFRTPGGAVINKAQLLTMEVKIIDCRYSKLTKKGILKVNQ